MSIADIKRIINTLPSLPAMPNIVAAALDVIKDPESNASELGAIITNDQALTSQILKVVNSAYYGLSRPITTVQQSITMVGFNEVRSIIISSAMKPMLTTQGGKELWEHSIKVGIGAEVIAKKLGRRDFDECFALGLLHDIGKIIFELYNPKAAFEVKKLISCGANSYTAEKMLFGFDHTDVGFELAAKWKLPKVIASALKYHHRPQLSDFPTTVGIVYAANRIVKDPPKVPVLEPEVARRLDFDIPNPTKLKQEINEKSALLIKILN
ncbi:MAG: HDOD domain-containing protein [Candidatus Gastranaerophilales bacterium]|nr:HDOD domain-containing protein [Candidatus Gastranaerophilales bacterium]